MGRIHLAQYKGQCWFLTTIVMNLCVPKNEGIFLSKFCLHFSSVLHMLLDLITLIM
jgi:hypothetical protein